MELMRFLAAFILIRLAFFGGLFALCLLVASLCGCRHVSYQSPDGTKVTATSLLTDPKVGEFDYQRSPTTQRATLKGYDSTSRDAVILEALKKLP